MSYQNCTIRYITLYKYSTYMSNIGENINVFILQFYSLLKTIMNYKEETLTFPPTAIPYTDNNSVILTLKCQG